MNNFNFRPLTGKAKWVATLMMMLFATSTFAQGEGTDSSTLQTIVIIVAVVALVVLLVAIYALQVLTKLLNAEEKKRAQETGEVPVPVLSFWQKFLKVANKRVDIEDEESIILDHNYDGIRELDNHLPPWWSYLFYATIVFGIFYVIFYHVTDTLPLQEEEYEIEMAEAAAMAEMRLADAQAAGTAFSEADLELTTDTDILASGAKIFSQQCAVCHKADGGGSIGPNLTDDYWLHGGDIQSLFTTIKVGVPDKGMISWEAMLSPEKMRDVANYIKSIRGTNPPAAKAPQGELYEEGAASEVTPTSETAVVEELATGDIGGSEEAKSTFLTLCAACHTADGGGIVGLGPNLTDKYWKNNDGSLEGIKNTITDGVEGTIMISWKASYSTEQIDELGKYILSLQGTTPVNPIAPEGELVE
jgi:cytochrome c oxidase cbb3-type subunit 3